MFHVRAEKEMAFRATEHTFNINDAPANKFTADCRQHLCCFYVGRGGIRAKRRSVVWIAKAQRSLKRMLRKAAIAKWNVNLCLRVAQQRVDSRTKPIISIACSRLPPSSTNMQSYGNESLTLYKKLNGAQLACTVRGGCATDVQLTSSTQSELRVASQKQVHRSHQDNKPFSAV